MVCLRLKRRVLNCFIYSDYDSLRDVRGEKRKKTTEYLILKKKNMKLTACMYIRGMIAYVRKYLFRKTIQIYCTFTILIICKENKK